MPRALAVVVALLVWGAAGWAQTGAVQGAVLDPSGRSLADADVRLLDARGERPGRTIPESGWHLAAGRDRSGPACPAGPAAGVPVARGAGHRGLGDGDRGDGHTGALRTVLESSAINATNLVPGGIGSDPGSRFELDGQIRGPVRRDRLYCAAFGHFITCSGRWDRCLPAHRAPAAGSGGQS